MNELEDIHELIGAFSHFEPKKAQRLKELLLAWRDKAVREARIDELDKLTDWLDERNIDGEFHAGMVYDYEEQRQASLKEQK